MEQLYIPLDYYIAAFRSLNCARKGCAVAPHKAVLLISVIVSIQKGKIIDNHIVPSDDLASEFRCVWGKVVGANPLWKCGFNYPFFHMENEPFWSLEKSDEYVRRNEYSLRQLQTCFKYATIHSDLFIYMRDRESSIKLIKALLEIYNLNPNFDFDSFDELHAAKIKATSCCQNNLIDMVA